MPTLLSPAKRKEKASIKAIAAEMAKLAAEMSRLQAKLAKMSESVAEEEDATQDAEDVQLVLAARKSNRGKKRYTINEARKALDLSPL